MSGSEARSGRAAAPGTPNSDRLVIPVAKGSLARFFVVCVLGIVGFSYLAFGWPDHRPLLGWVDHVLYIVGIVICVVSAIFAGRRLFDPTPGLVLDAEGLVDHSNALGAGRVRWDEITEIRVTKSRSHRFLTVVVRDPRNFIEQGGGLRRKIYESNYRKAGSPVNVTARTLRIPFDQLVARTSEFYQRYGSR